MTTLFRLTLIGILTAIAALPANALTLQQCLESARDNYPLISRYALLDKTTLLELSDINKSWLPGVSLSLQGSLQNDVPSFPDALKHMLAQTGTDMKGLGKWQYKAGVDLTQTIYDGGSAKARRQKAYADNEAQKAQLDVEMYAINQRVENLYFGILLIEEQMAQTENTIALLQSNITELKTMLRYGTAMQADVDMLEAQELTFRQQLTNARTTCAEQRRMLELLTGLYIAGEILERPLGVEPASDDDFRRPELLHFQALRLLNNSKLKLLDSQYLPKVGFFANAYYGYPGFDYFHSMRSRNPSFNVMAGLRLSWDITPFYTRKNSRARIDILNAGIDTDRETFLFNSRLQSAAQREQIYGMRKVMADDSKIVELRRNVRKAAESQLRNGIIDANALLAKITDENQANLNARYHEVMLLQLIYQLKHTLNR